MAEFAAGGYIAPSGSTSVPFDQFSGVAIPASVARHMSRDVLDRLNRMDEDDD
jgi:hypothetical protein